MRPNTQTNGKTTHAHVADMLPPAPASATLTGDDLAECRVLNNRIREANERLGAADFLVASAEAQRNEARSSVLRERQAFEVMVQRAATKIGIDITQPGWKFNPDTGQFARA